MAGTGPRWRQRQRTRKDLLQAAARLLAKGRTPALEEVADEALVSRATAYRYFPNVQALLVEASVDVAVPDAETLFADDVSVDPVARLDRLDRALHAMIAANEVPLRLMLASALERRARGGDEAPVRQNRRSLLIEAALAPARREFAPAERRMLTAALALLEGPEAMVVFRDVLRIDDSEAARVRRWAIRALVAAARRPAATVDRRAARR